MASVFIARPPQVVFDYIATPVHWAEYYPGSTAADGEAINEPLPNGARVTEYVSKLGLKGKLHWLVTECRPSSLLEMRTEAIEMLAFSSLRVEVQFRFAPSDNGTQLTRTWRHATPNVLLQLVDRWYLRANLERETDHALATLKRVLESR